MQARVYLILDREDIEKNFHPMFIAETFMRGSRPTQTRKGKALFKEMFPTEKEVNRVNALIRDAKMYYNKGIPNELKMTTDTFSMWTKLLEYCSLVA